jgi:hypothetical protein
MALRDVAEATKGMSQVATEADKNRENLYRMLSSEGNPRLNSLWAVLEAMGLRLSVEPIGAESVTVATQSLATAVQIAAKPAIQTHQATGAALPPANRINYASIIGHNRVQDDFAVLGAYIKGVTYLVTPDVFSLAMDATASLLPAVVIENIPAPATPAQPDLASFELQSILAMRVQ